MSPSKFLPPRPSFESIHKQAKKLVRQIGAGDPDALARLSQKLRLAIVRGRPARPMLVCQ